MPENAPNPTFSKRFATPISEEALPLNKFRRVFVYDGGCCSMPFECKRSADLLDYFIDLMRWLEPGEEVVGAAGWCSPDSLVMTRLEYAPTGVVAWLAGGGDDVVQTVYVTISTSLGKIKLVEFALQTHGEAGELAIITAGGDDVTVGFNHGGDGPQPDPELAITVFPETLDFPGTITGGTTTSKTLVVKNNGTDTVYLRRVSMSGPFTQRNSGIQKLVPGDFTQVSITYVPKRAGNHSGALSLDFGDGLTEYATFTGSAELGTRLSVSGNQFIRADGTAVRLRSVNWFGAESDIYTPHGLWARSYRDIIDQIADMDFNCVRLPFSGDVCDPERNVVSGVINLSLNPDLIGKKAIEVLDAVIGYMNEKGLYVVLDHHRRTAGDGADGAPFDGTYTYEDWQASWRFMATRYSGLDFVLGADLHNEPYKLEWDAWATYAQDTGNEILSIAPHWLIFVEGVTKHGSSSYWWGGELSGVRNQPVKLRIDGRLAYSVHEYGISVGSQPWLAEEGKELPANWPMNLYDVWRQHWGFIVEEGIAPVWIGEVGGKFGVDGEGAISLTPNAQYERQWLYHLQQYMNGDFHGDGIRQLPNTAQGMSFAYWALNPNSGDTGGLLMDNWITEQKTKLRLISMMLRGTELPYVMSLLPLPFNSVTDSSQMVIEDAGQDYSISFAAFLDAARQRLFEPGEVHFFATDVDPNERYAGQTWVRVPGVGKTIRLAQEDGSDLLAEGGSDTVTIAQDHLPEVELNVTGTATSTDLGTAKAKSAGSHHHRGGMGGPGASWGTFQTGTDNTGSYARNNTSDDGAHEHDVELGAHEHDVEAKTENMGGGQELTVTNAFITLAAWYRVS